MTFRQRPLSILGLRPFLLGAAQIHRLLRKAEGLPRIRQHSRETLLSVLARLKELNIPMLTP